MCSTCPGGAQMRLSRGCNARGIAAALPNRAQIVVCHRIVGIERKRDAELIGRAREIAGQEMRVTQIDARSRFCRRFVHRIGPERDRVAVERVARHGFRHQQRNEQDGQNAKRPGAGLRRAALRATRPLVSATHTRTTPAQGTGPPRADKDLAGSADHRAEARCWSPEAAGRTIRSRTPAAVAHGRGSRRGQSSPPQSERQRRRPGEHGCRSAGSRGRNSSGPGPR